TATLPPLPPDAYFPTAVEWGVRLSWRGANLLFLCCQSVQFAAEGHINAFTPLLLRDLGLTSQEIAVWTGLLVSMMTATSLLLAAITLIVLMPEPATRVRRGTVLGRTGEVLKLVWTTRPVRWNFFASFMMRGAHSVVDSYLPVRITQLAPDPAAAIGWILGIYGALTTVATWLVGRLVDKTDATQIYWRAMLFASAVTVGMALAPWVWLLGALAALRSIPMASGNTVLYAHAARILPPEEQTSIFALSPVPRNIGGFLFPLFAA